MVLERVDISTDQDPLQNVLHRGRYDFVLERLAPGQQVLEVGVGAGIFAKELFPKCGSYIGVEYDPSAAAEARRKTEGRAEIVQADARNLPFAENQFSFIICLEVLEHLGDWQAGVRNIVRCLRPDGTAIISIPYRRAGGKSEINPHHLYEPGENETVSLFRSFFETVDVYYQFFRETKLMTVARVFHLRRFIGLDKVYADLSAGRSEATSKLGIGLRANGMKLGLLIVANGKRDHLPRP